MLLECGIFAIFLYKLAFYFGWVGVYVGGGVALYDSLPNIFLKVFDVWWWEKVAESVATSLPYHWIAIFVEVVECVALR